MKQLLLILLATLCVTSCSQRSEEKTLVVYFSHTNNTATIAEYIQSLTDADTFRLEPVVAYPTAYAEHEPIAKKERDEQARPALKADKENINEYDVIFIGFPIWWEDAPMIIATFLESHDFTGKTIIPFCTHGGGGPGQAFNNVKHYAPNAKYLEGYAMKGSNVASDKPNVEQWLKRIGKLKN